MAPRSFVTVLEDQLGSPGELREQGVVLPLDGIGGEAAQHRGELETVTAPPAGHREALEVGITSDPQVLVLRVCIETETRVLDWSLDEGRKGLG